MKLFLSLLSMMTGAIALALMFAPDSFYRPTGIPMTAMVATLAQAHGATLAGLGLATWLSRSLQGRALRPILAGNLLMQLVSLAVVIRTAMLGAGAAVVPGVVLHVVIASGLAWCWRKAAEDVDKKAIQGEARA